MDKLFIRLVKAAAFGHMFDNEYAGRVEHTCIHCMADEERGVTTHADNCLHVWALAYCLSHDIKDDEV